MHICLLLFWVGGVYKKITTYAGTGEGSLATKYYIQLIGGFLPFWERDALDNFTRIGLNFQLTAVDMRAKVKPSNRRKSKLHVTATCVL